MKITSFLLLFSILSGCLNTSSTKTGLEGKLMPDFKLLLTDSSTVLDTKNIPTGKPIVLFYFGPNCPYSRAQMESIIEDIALLKDIHFYIFTTSPFQQMKGFYNHYKLKNYPNITTGVDYTYFFGKYFNAPGVPYTAVYDIEKHLKRAFVGHVNSDLIKEVASE